MGLNENLMNGETEAKRSIPYDELAAHYRSVSAARAAYLRAVEEIIIRRIAGNANSLLDVGLRRRPSGDAHCTVSAHI